jgi:hypothetical protein
VLALGVPELDSAFTAATLTLGSLSEVEVQKIATQLVQSIATAEGISNPQSIIPDPRTIFQLYCSMDLTPPDQIPINQGLAVGAVLALLRACRTSDEVVVTKLWTEAGMALSIARAFSEWFFIVNSLKINASGLNLLFPRQIRAAAKKKITKQASKSAKAAWDAKLAPEKLRVIQAFESGKPWASIKAAADKIHDDAVTTMVLYDKLYKWLLAYSKGKPF